MNDSMHDDPKIRALWAAIEAIGQKRGVRVLIADDEQPFREVVIGMLKPYKLEIDEAICGRDVLGKMQQRQYDVVLLDVNMPGMDGITAFREIKQRWPDTRVFFITGYPEFPGLTDALEAGVVRVIEKTNLSKALNEIFQPLCRTTC